MNNTFEIKIIDSYRNLPTCHHTQMEQFLMHIYHCSLEEAKSHLDFFQQFEKDYAVKWFEILTYLHSDIVGYMRILRNPDNSTNWFFCDVHTHPDYRRLGIATKMYYFAFQLLKEYEQTTHITASVSATNTSSMELHKKLGFIPSTTKPAFANFLFEPDETLYYYWLPTLYPFQNTNCHIKILEPMWFAYQKGTDNRIALSAKILTVSSQENTFLKIIWLGNTVAGFIIYYKDAEKLFVLDLFLNLEWHNKNIEKNVLTELTDNHNM